MKNIIFTVILLFFVTSCNNLKNKLTDKSKIVIEFEKHFVGKEIKIPQNFELVDPKYVFEGIANKPPKNVFQISSKETLLIEEIQNIK